MHQKLFYLYQITVSPATEQTVSSSTTQQVKEKETRSQQTDAKPAEQLQHGRLMLRVNTEQRRRGREATELFVTTDRQREKEEMEIIFILLFTLEAPRRDQREDTRCIPLHL